MKEFTNENDKTLFMSQFLSREIASEIEFNLSILQVDQLEWMVQVITTCMLQYINDYGLE